MHSISYSEAECPYCGKHAVVKEVNQTPGGRRLGTETIISLKRKYCDCHWKSKDAVEALLVRLASRLTNRRAYGIDTDVRFTTEYMSQ